MPTSLKIIPIGSRDITNDIALGLKVSLSEAQNIKLGAKLDDKKSEKKVKEIVSARVSDIFEIMESHLKKIGRNGLLPAGAIITGEGSKVFCCTDVAKKHLNLPARLANENSKEVKGAKHSEFYNDSGWSVVHGLVILGLNDDSEDTLGIQTKKQSKGSVLSWFKQFLP